MTQATSNILNVRFEVMVISSADEHCFTNSSQTQPFFSFAKIYLTFITIFSIHYYSKRPVFFITSCRSLRNTFDIIHMNSKNV